MATIGELHVKVTGIGRSRFGLWLLGVVARAFRIDLCIKVIADKEEVAEEFMKACEDIGIRLREK